MPDVIGDERSVAEAKIGARDLVPYLDPGNACVEAAGFGGLVAAILPAAGSELALGSTVQIWIGVEPGGTCSV